MVQVNDAKWSYLLARLKEQSHKQRESFVINFIIMNLLSDGYTDVNPVLQQPIKQDPKSKKREAIDLYFPQINLGIEIDEDQHFSEPNRAADKKRTLRIRKALKPVDIFSSLYTEKRINVQKDRSLNDIIIESQQLVQLIEFMVNNARQNNNYEPWMTMEERQQEFAKRPIYKPGLNLIWPNQSSATAAFKDAGWTIALRQRGTSYVYNDASKAQRIGLFWFPIIETREEADKHGRNWFNEISKDQKEIVEHYIGGKKNIKAPDTLPRITFKKGYDYYTNYSGNQYMGVYKYDPAISTLKERHYVLDENESEINLIVATKEKSSKKNGNNE